ncbi:chloroplastic group IIB intron splicing facilitator CRS2, chloroplastic-like [Dioscorea cayenensis subsp. rotundata]|uniref:Chloroplastic group IIB intron splicing facilitator CRS2, chloroplastic-like n=1 Tax=Dioscorea cayennensis subsp. rotundata TaxID=55577 RepID=A0AB40ANB0_DIOCR|nr:chloroplastic group IIB intron splicing facilitator CRS2, chloroplastic-like [Dioscorea cayenensis subsp. rotundata]
MLALSPLSYHLFVSSPGMKLRIPLNKHLYLIGWRLSRHATSLSIKWLRSTFVVPLPTPPSFKAPPRPYQNPSASSQPQLSPLPKTPSSSHPSLLNPSHAKIAIFTTSQIHFSITNYSKCNDQVITGTPPTTIQGLISNCVGLIGEVTILLVKPQAYMNYNGESMCLREIIFST